MATRISQLAAGNQNAGARVAGVQNDATVGLNIAQAAYRSVGIDRFQLVQVENNGLISPAVLPSTAPLIRAGFVPASDLNEVALQTHLNEEAREAELTRGGNGQLTITITASQAAGQRFVIYWRGSQIAISGIARLVSGTFLEESWTFSDVADDLTYSGDIYNAYASDQIISHSGGTQTYRIDYTITGSTPATANATAPAPSTVAYVVQREFNIAYAGVVLTDRHVPLELQVAPAELYRADEENSYINFILQSQGNGNGGTWGFGRIVGAETNLAADDNPINGYNLNNLPADAPFSIPIRLHTDTAEEQSDGTFIWRFIITSNGSAGTSFPTFSMVGTITNPTYSTLLPNQDVLALGPRDFPYRMPGDYRTEDQIISLDYLIDRHQATTINIDLELLDRAVHPNSAAPSLLIPVASAWRNAVAPISGAASPTAAYDPSKVYAVNLATGTGCFGLDTAPHGMGIGIHFIVDPANPDVIIGLSFPYTLAHIGYSRGRVIYIKIR